MSVDATRVYDSDPKRYPNEAINQAVSAPALAARLQQLDVIPVSDSTPASTASFLERETERWATVIKAAGLRIEN